MTNNPTPENLLAGTTRPETRIAELEFELKAKTVEIEIANGEIERLSAPVEHVELANRIERLLEDHDRCPPQARDYSRRRKTAILIMQEIRQRETPAPAEKSDLRTLLRDALETIALLTPIPPENAEPILAEAINNVADKADAMRSRISAALKAQPPVPHVVGGEALLDEVWNAAIEQAAVIADSCVHLTPDPGSAIKGMLNGRKRLHDPHPDELAVERFAAAMKAKLAKKRDEGRNGWDDKDDCSQLFLSQLLREHVEKGDPVDVGNLAMMLHQRDERISSLLETLQGE